MRHRTIATIMAAACLAAPPALAQDEENAAALAADFATQYAVGLPDFIVDAADACYQAILADLAPEDRAIIGAEPDFISGINALAAARPELPETLFPALDSCAGTVTAGEVMWLWVSGEELEGAAEEDQQELGACLLGAIERLTLDAKRGITRFQFGNFHQAVESMLFERPDLAGSIVEDMAACGVTVEANMAPIPR